MSSQLFKPAHSGIEYVEAYQPGKLIEELRREKGITKILKLASNENPIGASKKAILAAKNTLSELNRYPDTHSYNLKQELARQLEVDTNQLLVGNGSSEILELIARTFVNKRHEVIIPEYSFIFYMSITQSIGAKIITIPSINWNFSVEGIHAAITNKTRCIFIANPNNPTGNYLNNLAINKLIENIPENILIIIDEAYYEYVEAIDFSSAVPLIAKHPNLIVVRTFSKIYGLAGLRLGYSISHSKIVNLINQIRQPFNVNLAAMNAGIAALKDKQHIHLSKEINRLGFSQLTSAFNQLKLKYIPSATNFVTVDFGVNSALIYESLLERGIIIRPLNNYNMPQHLRITIGKKEDNNYLINAIKEIITSNKEQQLFPLKQRE